MTTDHKPPASTLGQDAEMIVEGIYRGLSDDKLRQMIMHGNEFDPVPVVVALNKAIQKELDRRKRENEELEADR